MARSLRLSLYLEFSDSGHRPSARSFSRAAELAAAASQSGRRASSCWQNWGRAVLQSHAGESKLQAQAGESSDAESVIFKEHFGGQEASKRGTVGGGHASQTLHFNNKPYIIP